MQAVILCAGKGARMNSFTKTLPKVMLEFNSKPVLEHTLETLQDLVEEVILVVGYKKEKIMNYFGEKFKNIKIKYVFQSEQLGTGHAVKICDDVLKEGRFLVMAGDSIFHKQDVENVLNSPTLAVLGEQVPDWKGYGVFLIKNNYLKQVVEKPETFVSDIVNKSLYLFDDSILTDLKNLKKSERGEYEITDALQDLCTRSKVKVFVTTRGVLHFTSVDDLKFKQVL